MARLEIYWSFRSPYSYLATDRLIALRRDYDLETEFRPVRPLALREPDFFSKGRAQFIPYFLKDIFREAARQGIDFAWPQPDPIQMDASTGTVDADQPYMARIMPLGIAACEAGKGIEFAAAAARKIWTGTPNWHEESSLSTMADEAGLELGALDAWLSGNGDEVDAIIARNEAAQLEHHWGVPLMVLDGEPFFGQDRIDALIWRLGELGLRRSV